MDENTQALQQAEKHLIDARGITVRAWEVLKQQKLDAGWTYQPDVMVFTRPPQPLPTEETPPQ